MKKPKIQQNTGIYIAPMLQDQILSIHSVWKSVWDHQRGKPRQHHLELNDYNLGRETLHTNPAFFQALG